MGFSVPMGSWLRTSLKPVFENVVLQSEMEPLVNVPLVRSLYQTHLSGVRDYSRELWNLLMLGCWLHCHGRGGGAGELEELLTAAKG
jgi:asparagine synthase (glutamine-hydrolysing)